MTDGISTKRRGEEVLLNGKHWIVVFLWFLATFATVLHYHRWMPPVVSSDHLDVFSEERARTFLRNLTDFGPRPTGSEALEKHAANLILSQFDKLEEIIQTSAVNRLDRDIQRPNGCFDISFHNTYTLCYHKITNIIARIGPKSGPADHALMLNCHFDSVIDSPGATDDGVSCAIMLEVMQVLARSKQPLAHDVVFLFNGAEEYGLHGSHGFITEHPWRHSIRAFLNLEGAGAGGREVLFQAGPGNSWLLHTYLEHAPYPYCSVLGQEVFQSGIIPSDTDFRIFRDVGKISGLDIAYVRNGWVYHTEFDEELRIESGAIQRAGENTLAVVLAIINEPYLAQPGKFEEANQWVFYDVIGVFNVYYPVAVGQFLNYTMVIIVILLTYRRISTNVYTFTRLRNIVLLNLIVIPLAMLLVTVVTVSLMTYADRHLSWYKQPLIVIGLYIFPQILTGLYLHSLWSDSEKKLIKENVYIRQEFYDVIPILFSLILFALTFKNLASAYITFNFVLFPVLKGFLDNLMDIKNSPKSLFWTQLTFFTPVLVIFFYVALQLFELFIPVLGRAGTKANPEIIVGFLCLIVSFVLVFIVHNLMYMTNKMSFTLAQFYVLFIAFVLVLLMSEGGNTYNYANLHPKLRRMLVFHTHREVYPFETTTPIVDDALFVQGLDYRNTKDLPKYELFEGIRPNCSQIADDFCHLPYYNAIYKNYPPSQVLWVPVGEEVPTDQKLVLEVVETTKIGNGLRNCSFTMIGGADRMTLHITPVYGLKKWSFTELDMGWYGARNTYYVTFTSGLEKPPNWNFWLVVGDHPNEQTRGPVVEVAAVSLHGHGPSKTSKTLGKLIEEVRQRRMTSYDDKWMITMITASSEVVVRRA